MLEFNNYDFIKVYACNTIKLANIIALVKRIHTNNKLLYY